MEITVELAPVEQKPVLRNMCELYRYDFSAIDGRDLSEHGLFDYGYLDHYWTERGRFPWLVRVDGQLAGFVFLRREDQTPVPRMNVAEFFVMRKYRRHGVGDFVAQQVFDRYPGPWSLAIDLRNEAALCFWRTVVDRVTHGQFTESPGDTAHRIRLEFEIRG